MKKLFLVSVMVIFGLFCFARLGSCVEMTMLGCSDTALVGITGSQFVSINFATGLLTELNSNVGGSGTNLHVGGGWGCVGGGTFYAIRDKSGSSYVIGIDVSTGTLTESPALHF